MTMKELAERVPGGCTWSTGTGTKKSHAQIIAPDVRRHSFYAVADSEEEALSIAMEELSVALRASQETTR
jgi:hypothetical protein